MSFFSLRTGAALAALGGLAATASAQLPAPAATPTAPQVVRWPGGYLWMDGPEVVVRNGYGTGRSTNVVTGSGNGFGNRIVVGGGGAGGVTVVQNARNGIGNRLILDDDDLLLDLDELLGRKPACKKPVPAVIPPADPAAPAALPAPMAAPAPVADPPSYRGKASPFWTKKMFSDGYDCNLYWCPTTKLWFRYGSDDDTYRPVPTQPPAPVDEK